jgi:general secretion pathway protein L
MSSLRSIATAISRWIDCVAEAIVAAVGRLTFPRNVRIEEEQGGTFAVRVGNQGSVAGPPSLRVQFVEGRVVAPNPEQFASVLRGNRAELILSASRFLFRPLELPGRASEFLDGIVRAQIDRLTPWTANDAVFGSTKPVPAGTDRILVTVAATARTQVMPYLQELTALGARFISVSTPLPDAGGGIASIKVLDETARPVLDVHRVRRALLAVLVVTGLVATSAVTAATVIGSSLEARQDELARRIAERRAAIRSGGVGAEGALTAHGKLQKRKHDTPSTVIVLEALSQILPDHTYVTELRIESDNLRLIGITRDAPSLIRLIEQSSHFTRATFFAPTTRQPSDPGERFHIEAQIRPVFLTRS